MLKQYENIVGHPQPRSWTFWIRGERCVYVECPNDTTNMTPSPPIVRGILQRPMRMGALCSFSELTASWCGSSHKSASLMLWGKRLFLKTLSEVARSHIRYGELKPSYDAGVTAFLGVSLQGRGPRCFQPPPSQDPLDWSVGTAVTAVTQRASGSPPAPPIPLLAWRHGRAAQAQVHCGPL